MGRHGCRAGALSLEHHSSVTRQAPASARTLALGPGPEFDRIREIVHLLGREGAGLGDDCALLPAGDTYFAISTDVSVEQVHFRLDWIHLAEVGWRATAAALSDLAAAGAEPAGVLAAVTMPAAAAASDLLEVMTGVRDATRSVGAPVLGGDLSSGPVWSLAMTVIGRTRAPVSRGGARPGDRLWVTGVLGGSRAALEAWRRKEQPPAAARECYAHPSPRIAAARWLGDHGAHAMIDLSDGLAGDAGHLAAASGVALEIDVGSIPVAPEADAEARRQGMSPQHFAAEGGEDFELLVALPPGFDAVAAFTREAGLPLTSIGTIGPGRAVQFSEQGRAVMLKGFNHFG
jgi:thiamine-monophosphate kinase